MKEQGGVLVLGNLVREMNGQPPLELHGDSTEAMFRDAIRRSAAFRWAACVSDHSQAAIHMYLLERAEQPTEPRDVTLGNVIEVWGDLAHQHEATFDMNLHLVREVEMSAEALRAQVLRECESEDSGSRLLWEEELV